MLNNSFNFYAELAYQALIREVELTPKPGLVDKNNSGAHRDMSIECFYASATAIKPFFIQFIQCGYQSIEQTPQQLLANLRQIGLVCEQAMFSATAGINTHKGSIFALGLLCGGIGRLLLDEQLLSSDKLCYEVSILCQHLSTELSQVLPSLASCATNGEKAFYKYGYLGARGEALSGFASVRTYAVPYYHNLVCLGVTDELALIETLVMMISRIVDTNLISRGGLAGLAWMQTQAQQILQTRQSGLQLDLQAVIDWDQQCIARNLSPGGSADLLIITWFLVQIDYNIGAFTKVNGLLRGKE